MFRCNICDSRFDEPGVERELQWHEEVGSYETILHPYCPICGEDNFDKEEEDNDD